MTIFTAEIIALVAPGKMAVTDFARSGTARETYRHARRLARISLSHRPDAIAPGHRVQTLMVFSRDGKFVTVDSVRRTS